MVWPSGSLRGMARQGSCGKARLVLAGRVIVGRGEAVKVSWGMAGFGWARIGKAVGVWLG